MADLYLLFGVILVLGLWNLSGIWEWNVPESLQMCLKGWRVNLPQVRIVWKHTWKPGMELERYLWNITKILPKLEKTLGYPLRLELQIIYNGDDWEEKYISCLGRRFPEISIETLKSDFNNFNNQA